MSNDLDQFKIDEAVVITENLKLAPDNSSYNADITAELKKVYEKVEDAIPFGNSDAQRKLAVISAELGAGRGYRAAAINLASELGKLNKAVFNLRRMSLDVKELRAKQEEISEAQDRAWFGHGNAARQIQYERLQIDIEEKMSGLFEMKKLITDTVRNINILKPIVEKQDMTREEFEALEIQTFRTKMVNQMNGVGDQITLLGNMEKWNYGDDLYTQLCLSSSAKYLSPQGYNEGVLGEGSGKKIIIEAETNEAIQKSLQEIAHLLPKQPETLPQPGTLPLNLFNNVQPQNPEDTQPKKQ